MALKLMQKKQKFKHIFSITLHQKRKHKKIHFKKTQRFIEYINICQSKLFKKTSILKILQHLLIICKLQYYVDNVRNF